MLYQEAFNQTIEHFRLSARDIASKAGMHESSVSNFRTGRKDLNLETWERLMSALPEEARQYIYLKVLVGTITNRGISVLLSAISDRIMQESESEAVDSERQSAPTIKRELSMVG